MIILMKKIRGKKSHCTASVSFKLKPIDFRFRPVGIRFRPTDFKFRTIDFENFETTMKTLRQSCRKKPVVIMQDPEAADSNQLQTQTSGL